MNLASKIILGFLIVFAMVFFVLAMYTLDLRGWQKSALAAKKNLEQTTNENALLRNSDDANARDNLARMNAPASEDKGRKQLRTALSNLVVQRGRMWLGNAAPAANTPDAPLIFTVRPNAAQPTPLTLAPKTSLFVFEYPPVAGDAANNAPPGRYLGEFTVLEAPPVDAAGGKFAMAPSRPLSPRELKKLGEAVQSGMPWLAYETLPQDRYGTLKGLTDEELEKRFPGVFSTEQKTELALEGQSWIEGKHAPERKDSLGNYRRPLVNYGHLLQSAYEQRSLLNAKLASLKHDLDLMIASNEDVLKQITYRKEEIVFLKEELARSDAEAKLAQDHLKAVEEKLAAVRAAATRIEEDNRRLVEQLAERQRQIVESANLETAAVTP
jgi:hypothetical protein